MRRFRTPALAAALLAVPGLAQAHHPLGGMAPQTPWQGLASGLAHPVIGPDHLAFVLAAGVLAAAMRGAAGAAALLGFLACGAAGSLLHLAGIGLGPVGALVEALVAGSALAAGAVLLLRPAGTRTAWLPAGFALAGLVHGHAFAEAAVGSQPGPVGAYLAGLALVQGALGFGAMALARHWPRALGPRVAAGAAALVGAVSLAAALMAWGCRHGDTGRALAPCRRRPGGRACPAGLGVLPEAGLNAPRLSSAAAR